MSDQALKRIELLLDRDRWLIAEEWLGEVVRAGSGGHADKNFIDELRSRMTRMLDALASACRQKTDEAVPLLDAGSELAKLAADLGVERARHGFAPTDTAFYVILLKNVLTRHLLRLDAEEPAETAAEREALLTSSLAILNAVLDKLTLLNFNVYVETRERIISQQSLSLVELSSPVVRLWDKVLLVPLIGVIDTVRARLFTERMLAAITRHEAVVTILDVTGVPVFDTGVARHIMKAIDAAQLLGSRMVITGLSPEGAQTLTKLNINFANVTSRASLRAGVAEALAMVGRRIVPMPAGGATGGATK